ncbi:MAG TPA: crossover junction endodeoxyribonuclease RuvC [Bacteroidales bacterium]|nr:crossover junction endodeoxyribonuclease RuvC [Bacteroidales bacterium]
MLTEQDRIILGIDPGTTIMGYSLIECQKDEIEILTLGVLRLSMIANQPLKLKRIFEGTLSLIDEYKPDELAIEAPFYGKNVQSMLKLGRAQGVAIAAALYRNIPIFEYSPKKIKQSVTGNGNASKQQVAAMLGRLLTIAETPESLDATDALAAAVCHYLQDNPYSEIKKYTGWKAFLHDNPDRREDGGM